MLRDQLRTSTKEKVYSLAENADNIEFAMSEGSPLGRLSFEEVIEINSTPFASFYLDNFLKIIRFYRVEGYQCSDLSPNLVKCSFECLQSLRQAGFTNNQIAEAGKQGRLDILNSYNCPKYFQLVGLGFTLSEAIALDFGHLNRRQEQLPLNKVFSHASDILAIRDSGLPVNAFVKGLKNVVSINSNSSANKQEQFLVWVKDNIEVICEIQRWSGETFFLNFSSSQLPDDPFPSSILEAINDGLEWDWVEFAYNEAPNPFRNKHLVHLCTIANYAKAEGISLEQYKTNLELIKVMCKCPDELEKLMTMGSTFKELCELGSHCYSYVARNPEGYHKLKNAGFDIPRLTKESSSNEILLKNPDQVLEQLNEGKVLEDFYGKCREELNEMLFSKTENNKSFYDSLFDVVYRAYIALVELFYYSS